jgi:hypothetical protein
VAADLRGKVPGVKKPAETEKTAGDPELAWRVLGLLNLYRLVVPSVLVALVLLASRPQLLGAVSPPPSCIRRRLSHRRRLHRPASALVIRTPGLHPRRLDIVAVTALLVTSGGAGSGVAQPPIPPVTA